MNRIDLRSDTVTRPTPEMRKAMHEAEVGDDGRILPDGSYGDATVTALQERAADLFGKQAALYTVSGTLANLVALRTWCNRGATVAVGHGAHILRREKSAFDPDYFGLSPIALDDKDGLPNADSVRDACARHRPALLCLENTHNAACGAAWGTRRAAPVYAAARSAGVPIHLDGARLFNAAVALATDVKDLAADVDSVMFCLSKGLGAPMGSVLVGTTGFIEHARQVRKLLGGQWRQAGVVAAAGLVALEGIDERLAADHAKARRLATLLPAELVDPERVHTNMIQVSVGPTGLAVEDVITHAAEQGLLLHSTTAGVIRLVTHRDLSDFDIDRAGEILGSILTTTATS